MSKIESEQMPGHILKRGRIPLLAILFSAALTLIFFGMSTVTDATVPSMFTNLKVVDANDSINVAYPTDMAFTPDGRMLITTQTGKVMVFQNGAIVPTPALSFSGSQLCTNVERGLLGIAVDPNFATNNYIYLYYTFNRFSNSCPTDSTTSPVNRVSRFVLSNANTISFASETVLLTNIPSLNGNHNGGDLQFGLDGYLYISVGDSGCKMKSDGSGDTSQCASQNPNARSLSILSAKILRIQSDGGIPPSNPKASTTGAVRCGDPANSGIYLGASPCKEMFAWGLRNPFRFTFKPGTNQFYINDVGQDVWEEIDEGFINADYGWNVREGHCAAGEQEPCSPNPAGMTPPVHDYNHNIGCGSITGGAFVPAAAGWPDTYSNNYLFADYNCGKIFRITVPASGGSTATQTEFATALGSPTNMMFGPYQKAPGQTIQALYYTNYYNGCNNSNTNFCGEIRVIYFNGSGNQTPVSILTASPLSGPSPLNVTFNGSSSYDPDSNGSIQKYLWDFGDGSTCDSSVTPSCGATTSHTYTVASPVTRTASLRVQDNIGAISNPAKVTLFPGNTKPTVNIISPAVGATFAVGDTISLNATATDAEDNPHQVPADHLTWSAVIHHVPVPNGQPPADCNTVQNRHIHPLFGPATGNGFTFTAPAPEDLNAIECGFLEVQFTAVDQWGLSTTVTRTIQPRKVPVTFAAVPTNATLTVNDVSFSNVNSKTFDSWEGYQLTAQALTQAAPGGGYYVLQQWSDGNDFATRIIPTPAQATTYTATFSTENCNPSGISTNDLSPGSVSSCGSLLYALANSPSGDVITIQQGVGTFSLSQTLTVGRALKIEGSSCTNLVQFSPAGGFPSTNPIPPGVQLTAGAGLANVRISGFPGAQLKIGPGGSKLGPCVQVSKT